MQHNTNILTLPPGMRKRSEPAANYSAVFFKGKTIRTPINAQKPITELRFPEFYDISMGNRCRTGKCDFCYASATPTGIHYKNIALKIKAFFGAMPLNNRPFQVAIGGEQEPLENPEFWEGVQAFNDLQIVANYTTNGVLVNDKIIEKTLAHCGGVAVTLHPHLEKFWRRAIDRLAEAKIRTNIHIIISNRESIDYLDRLYKELDGKVEYFVLLPYMNVGFASGDNSKQIDFDYLESWLDKHFSRANMAFGANFYPFLLQKRKYGVSLYPPEIMSKYIKMGDMKVYNNSFECKEVIWNDGVML